MKPVKAGLDLAREGGWGGRPSDGQKKRPYTKDPVPSVERTHRTQWEGGRGGGGVLHRAKKKMLGRTKGNPVRKRKG